MPRLNNKQKEIINKNRQKKLNQAELKNSALVIAHLGFKVIVEFQGELIACDFRKNLGEIAVNDRVLLKNGVIEAIFPRNNTFYKWDGRKKRAVASNLSKMLIVLAYQPEWQNSLIDRYLVAALNSQISPAIFCNKQDLKKENSPSLALYEKLNIPLFYGSADRDDLPNDLLNFLSEGRIYLCGQSGVGKSSLISSLLPDAKIWVQKISELSGLGKHTTTNLRLYKYGEAALIDSPGVRGLYLNYLNSQEIWEGFPEIYALTKNCRFSDCRHENEPYCGIKKALKNKEISLTRLQSLKQILGELPINS